jgi:hypothetical protein
MSDAAEPQRQSSHATGENFSGGEWFKDLAAMELEFYRAQAYQNQSLVFYSALAIFLTSTVVPVFVGIFAQIPDARKTGFDIVLMTLFFPSLALVWVFILLQAHQGGIKKAMRLNLASELQSIIDSEATSDGESDALRKDSSYVLKGVLTEFNEACLAHISSYRRLVLRRSIYQRLTMNCVVISILMFLIGTVELSATTPHN